jgi:hypothetical protein
MCLLCIDIQKNKLTPKEIARNYIELINDEHYVDVLAEITKLGLDEEVAKELNQLYIERSLK